MSEGSDIHKLTGAYAVDALDDLERARFERHLSECDDCRAEVAELRETAALLAQHTATPAPASLRSSVLAGIAQVRPMPPEVPQEPVVMRPVDTRAGRRSWTPFLVAAVLALIVGIGAAVIQPWSGDDVPRLTAAEQVLQAPDAQNVSVDLGEAGRATVTRSKSHDRAVITTQGMASAPQGKDYELWFIDGDTFTSAGLMPDDPDQSVVLDGSASDAQAVGITVEPDGGSKQPTTAPIAVFDLEKA